MILIVKIVVAVVVVIIMIITFFNTINLSKALVLPSGGQVLQVLSRTGVDVDVPCNAGKPPPGGLSDSDSARDSYFDAVAAATSGDLLQQLSGLHCPSGCRSKL